MPFVKETFQIPTPQGVMAFLQQTLHLSQREAQRFVDKGRVAQNGEVVRDKKRILRGEVSVSYFRAVDLGIVPIFETPEFAVFDKPAGLLSHPKGRFWHFSLLDAVRFHFGSEANLINRLDYETSGVILASKNKKSEAELKGLFERRAVEKSYLAVCSPPLNLHSIDFANAESSKKIRAKHPKKSFCYFWLLPKVESSPSYRLQTTKKGKFVESFAESTIPSPSISLDSFRKRAAPPSPLPLRAKSSRFSLLGGEPRLSVSSKKSAGGTSAPLIPDFLHHETGEFLVLTHDSKLDSTQSVESKKSFCYFWLKPKVESFPPTNFN